MLVIRKGLFMKKFLLFFGGFICGVILTFLALFIISQSSSVNNRITMFETPGECLIKGSVKVFQVLEPSAALAATKGNFDYSGMPVLLVNDKNEVYYDEQVVKAGKCFRQIGTYQYETRDNFLKTVPVVIAE